ncbi:hypothetical protein SUDANB6_01425 [Streptomyces sp. enrichment culture]|uniref:DUF485 domain-containing protein n=1 Tax=Streptomyces sp. enrichment culture TaxID=1795815 RepID=UPI003F551ABB
MQSSNDRSCTARDGHDPAFAGVLAWPERDGSSDPWYDVLASGRGRAAGVDAPGAAVPEVCREPGKGHRAAAGVYLEVQRGPAFRDVRSRYRRFVVPALLAFLGWYAAYVVAVATAPGLMARPVTGAANVAMLAGTGQFLTVFALTWAYCRHARLRRDRAALELRWEIQDRTRGLGGGAS